MFVVDFLAVYLWKADFFLLNFVDIAVSDRCSSAPEILTEPNPDYLFSDTPGTTTAFPDDVSQAPTFPFRALTTLFVLVPNAERYASSTSRQDYSY